MKVPLKGLISKRYADQLAAGINATQARSAKVIKPGKPQPYESDQTTRYSVVDKAGNAVAVTYTLNTNFGSGIVAKGTWKFCAGDRAGGDLGTIDAVTLTLTLM